MMVTTTEVHRPAFMYASCMPRMPPPRQPLIRCPVDSSALKRKKFTVSESYYGIRMNESLSQHVFHHVVIKIGQLLFTNGRLIDVNSPWEWSGR
jgi:hypothetical protein